MARIRFGSSFRMTGVWCLLADRIPIGPRIIEWLSIVVGGHRLMASFQIEHCSLPAQNLHFFDFRIELDQMA